MCIQYPTTWASKIILPPGGLVVLGGVPWKTTSAMTEAGGAACMLSLVGAPEPYITGLVDVLQAHQREIRGGDHIWLNKRWDDDEPPVLRVRRIRRRPELGVAEEIARRSGAYFLQPSTSDQLCDALISVLDLPQSSKWDDVVCRLSERGDTQLTTLVGAYLDSGCDHDLPIEPELTLDEGKTPHNTIDDFLELINGSRA
ncbi:hypothetical protein [Actinomadura sediminis]|uniref:Uncharacterized protein n=1 Tax=Actinomadura sediminis TaxID=1038904 RepID=A0ABW3ENR2_9ACTN